MFRICYKGILLTFSITILLLNHIEFSLAGSYKVPIVRDNSLKVELVFQGPTNGTSNMAFLGEDDILVLDRTSGSVMRIINGTMLTEPLVNVNTVTGGGGSGGLLGIATTSDDSAQYVFLYYTKTPRGYDNDLNASNINEEWSVNETFGYVRECNCLYKYELINNKLTNPKLLLSLPAQPGGHRHQGGEISIGPDNNIYLSIGDLGWARTKALNVETDFDPDGTGGLLRITQDGKPVGKGILGGKHPLDLYYAYGIRNSFGMDFDPITGNLWDTENGPGYGDEINLITPGFNSGWKDLTGLAPSGFNYSQLVTFDGKGRYSDPEFVWNSTVAPTALLFFNSDVFGSDYKNDMFVADYNNGYIYHFDLWNNRTELALKGPLEDKVAGFQGELQSVVFARQFEGGIIDMQIGPDGFLYILTQEDGIAFIYRILPKSENNTLMLRPTTMVTDFLTSLTSLAFWYVPIS